MQLFSKAMSHFMCKDYSIGTVSVKLYTEYLNILKICYVLQ